MQVKVRNMLSSNDNYVPNQFIIEIANGATYFQSYDSIVAKIENNEIFLDENYWDYSQTTRKYLYKFLREEAGLDVYCKKDVLKLINEGIIKLSNLN